VEHLVLYDGVCGLCNRLSQRILRRDRLDRFRFAALRSSVAADLLRCCKRDPNDWTPCTYLAITGSHPNAFFAKVEGGMSYLYQFIAKHWYRWFGRNEHCLLPDPRHQSKFIDSG